MVTGNPVRPEVLNHQPDKAISALGLTGFGHTLPTVYITGGAQGSVQINTVVRAVLPWLLTQANVIHQCGATSIEESRQYAARLPDDVRPRYLVTDFVGPELPDVLALVDVVISRSGAGTIAELTALGKPSVLIPLATSAGNEQEHNALRLQEAGAAVALVRDAVTSEGLRIAVAPLLSSSGTRQQMAQQARSLGRPDAADRLVEVLLDVATG